MFIKALMLINEHLGKKYTNENKYWNLHP